MGKIEKGQNCSAINCSEKAIRSLSSEEVKSIDIDVKEGRKAYLCEKHYKDYKKRCKDKKRIDKWRWQA